jgi:hypothetical protein
MPRYCWALGRSQSLEHVGLPLEGLGARDLAEALSAVCSIPTMHTQELHRAAARIILRLVAQHLTRSLRKFTLAASREDVGAISSAVAALAMNTNLPEVSLDLWGDHLDYYREWRADEISRACSMNAMWRDGWTCNKVEQNFFLHLSLGNDDDVILLRAGVTLGGENIFAKMGLRAAVRCASSSCRRI